MTLRYRMLGSTGLRVSELCLGTMSFGDDWGFGADEAESHRVLDAFADAGGNFLDTANKYHNGHTEEIVGRWLEGKRHRQVVATKYTLAMDHTDPNAAGNGRKNLVRSVEDSLRRLRTDYIDLLWVHAWDDLTPWQETMRGLDDLVRSGKVLYVGVSDTPAWVVAASNVAAELRGWTAYCGLQIEYSLLERTVERELLPMAEHFGMSVLAWAPLGGGVLTGKYTRGDGQATDSKRSQGNAARGRTSDRNLAIARKVERAMRRVPFLRRQCEQIAALQDLFGQGTAIRFRYVHDFVYGFDWAKWVARDPAARASVGPFEPPFLAFMLERGHQLLQLIADGRDRKYPPLPDDRPRNPFGFSREPEAEIALHQSLAADGLLPVEAWRVDAQPRWDRPYAELRRQRALALGLG
ncbi:MAG: aldo/keto reductase [Myxococcales bacterium]|nr:aldo/keto reductase [Myxococcales bacterium]